MAEIEKAGVRVFTSKEALRSMLYQEKGGINTGAHNKLYKRSLFAEIRYPFGLIYEDLATTYKVFFDCERIALANEKMYLYRVRQDSIMRQTYSPKMVKCINISRNLYNDVSKRFPELSVAAASRAFSVNRAIYLTLPYDKKDDRAKVWAEMKKYRKTVILDPHARKRERIAALLTYLGSALFHRLFSKSYRRHLMNA